MEILDVDPIDARKAAAAPPATRGKRVVAASAHAGTAGWATTPWVVEATKKLNLQVMETIGFAKVRIKLTKGEIVQGAVLAYLSEYRSRALDEDQGQLSGR